jgi:hypothetical protein
MSVFITKLGTFLIYADNSTIFIGLMYRSKCFYSRLALWRDSQGKEVSPNGQLKWIIIIIDKHKL